jgi:pimeloyl-ACP methyl ester carboxylesterase
LGYEQRDLGSAALLGDRRPEHSSRGRAKDRRDLAAGSHHGISAGGLCAPETWARHAYRNLIYFNEVDKGGHFAAWEEPELFSAELRAAFRSLR